MFELKVEVGQMCCRATAAFAEGRGSLWGRTQHKRALAVRVNSTHFLLTSGNFLLFLSKEARVKVT